jgi:hypothetical protein
MFGDVPHAMKARRDDEEFVTNTKQNDRRQHKSTVNLKTNFVFLLQDTGQLTSPEGGQCPT